MSVGVRLRLALTLLLVFLFGVTSVDTAPVGTHVGAMWPVGLATGALLLGPRQWVPPVAVLIGVLGVLSFRLGGYPLDVSVGYGIAVAVEAVVVHRALTAGWTGRPWLRSNTDFARFVLSCAVGALVGAILFALVAALTSFGTPWKVGVAVFVTHAAAQLVVVGLFKVPPDTEGEWGQRERWAAWVNTVVITTAAFLPVHIPSLAFLVVPGLGWMALRAPMREAMLQLLVVSVIASTLTSAGHGPFSDPVLSDNLDPEFRLLPLQAFLIGCAMVTIPFSMTVARQRRTAAEVRAERARSERLVQSARGIAIIGTDENGRINLFNPGAELVLGYRPEEVYGHSTRMFHTDAEIARQAASLGCAPAYLSVIRATRDLPPGTAREWEFIRKDGIPRILSTILSPVRDENGTVLGYVATGDDVTERLKTQTALETALETERSAVERLTEVDRVKDRFVSSVSHELRTPITNIVGYLELLLDGAYGELNDQQARSMSRIDLNSRRLLTLIDDLLTLSSMESLDQPRNVSDVDLTTVIRRAEEVVRSGLMRRDLKLEVEVPAEPVVIAGDAGQLERLVINLATNAVKFTLDGGMITLRLQAPEDGVGPVIEVEDTGIGIPEEEQEMLFSRFFRAAQARETAVPGSGLGLSIAKSIAELHGGQISARSVYGSGSTFRVEFPPLAVVGRVPDPQR